MTSENDSLSCRMIENLLSDIIENTTTEGVTRFRSRHSPTLVRLVHDVSAKYDADLQSMCRMVRINDEDSCRRMISKIIDKQFSDDRFSWGRVVSVFAYVTYLARVDDASERGANLWLRAIAAESIDRKITPWIRQQGGWGELDRIFAESTDGKMSRYRFFDVAVAFAAIMLTTVHLFGVFA